MQRLREIESWLGTLLPGRKFTLSPASADASFRRYFRVTFEDGTSQIVMDAPPGREDCQPWLFVRELFSVAGAHVPELYARDMTRGFLLISDLGVTTYLAALADAGFDAAAALYADAIAALVRIQAASRPNVLPEYDRSLLKRELDLFPEWYVARHLGVDLTAAERAVIDAAFERILAVNLAEPQVFVHRDYHSRNLMRLAAQDANPGIIDFQDAVFGPISYDLASLFRDAYIDWPEEQTLDWLIRYWEQARRAKLPVRADFSEFYRDYEWMSVQRCLKVLGIFARLYHRDGKDGYLKEMPRVAAYLGRTASRYRELGPLSTLLTGIESRVPNLGYSFS